MNEIKTVLDLMLINYEVTKENNKNIDEVSGYLACLVDVGQLPMLKDVEGIQEYKDKITKELLS